jgi:hypothetical protein
VGPSRLVPPIKRQRLMTTARNGKNNQSQKTSTVPPLDQLKVYSKFTRLIINRKDFFRRNVPNCEHSCRGGRSGKTVLKPTKNESAIWWVGRSQGGVGDATRSHFFISPRQEMTFRLRLRHAPAGLLYFFINSFN